MESALKDAVQKKKHLSLNDLQLREEVHIDHNHNWWIRINDAKKLRFLRVRTKPGVTFLIEITDDGVASRR